LIFTHAFTSGELADIIMLGSWGLALAEKLPIPSIRPDPTMDVSIMKRRRDAFSTT
jgi:hypothetical protein